MNRLFLCLAVVAALGACTGPGFDPTDDPFTDRRDRENRRDTVRNALR